jgi:hypothetical protein
MSASTRYNPLHKILYVPRRFSLAQPIGERGALL